MKALSLKNKILSVVAGILVLTILGFLVYTAVVMVKAFQVETVDGEDESKYEFVFEGNITIYDTEYAVKLKGVDQEFTVNANSIKDITGGTYTFTEGQGWTFIFDDKTGTIVRSMYDKDSGNFSFIYSLDMGSRGAGNLKFVYEDKDFNAANESWKQIPSFSGTAYWFGGVLSATTMVSCDANGNFRIFCTGGEIDEISGTYRESDDGYLFTAENGTEYAATLNGDGLYEMTVGVYRPALAAYGAANSLVTLTQVVLTVE